MNVLILGGTGKIGSSLATALFDLNPDINIRIVDNLCGSSLSSISHLHVKPNFEFFLGDVCDPGLMWTMMADRQVIINCIKSPTHEQAVYSIIGGSQNILELLDENQQYIYISTTDLSVELADNLTIASTISAEAMTVAYQRQLGRNTLVLRAPSTYKIEDLANNVLSSIKNSPNGIIDLSEEVGQ